MHAPSTAKAIQSMAFDLHAVTACCCCCRYGDNLWHSLLTILSAVMVDCLLLGIAISTACW
jgi:hypothetical protein